MNTSTHTPLARIELLAGRLSLAVYAHEVHAQDGLVPCWTWVSQGFALEGHPELTLTIRRGLREPVEPFSQDPAKLFGALWHRLHAVEGALLQSGDVLALEPGEFLATDQWAAVGALPAMPLAQVPALDANALMLIALYKDEFELARDYGLSRVSARMGRDAGLFPSAPWLDRDRKSVAKNDRPERTVLGKCLRVTSRAGCVFVSDDCVQLELPARAAEGLRAPLGELPEDTALVLLLPHDPLADGVLVWQPNDREITAIGAQDSRGTRVCGNFVALIHGQPANGANPLEDGFAVRTKDTEWQALRRALAAGQDWSLTATDESLGFALRFVR
ncbi:MAG: hypothetical protein Q8Q09_09955 [Deltaproteobacteria bacterium]|nr:hypothetical protein [Deltaproteobacteria bacterium]